MIFRESFITDAGVELLARVLGTQGTLTWTRAATSSLDTSDYSAHDMNSITEESFGTKTSSGSITNAIVNDEQSSVTIFSELNNQTHSGEARTYGAWAKIEGDNEDVLVVVARCGAGVVPTYINPASDGIVKAFVDFALQISTEQAQAIEVSETNYYASNDALEAEKHARQDLAQRVVTTHSATDTTQGDNQTILGNKTFNGKVTANGNIEVYGSSYFDDFATFDNGLRTNNDINIGSGGSLNVSGKVNGSTVDFGDGLGIGELMAYQSSSGSLFAGSVGASSNLTGIDIQQDHSYNNSHVRVQAATEYGTTKNAASVTACVEDGSAFVTMTAYKLTMPSGRDEYEVDSTIYATFELDCDAARLRFRDPAIHSLIAENLDDAWTFCPGENDAWWLGDDDHKWAHVVTRVLNCADIHCSGSVNGNVNGNLSGLIPTKDTSSTNPPIGSILLVTLLKHSSMSTTLPCGTEVGGNMCQVKSCGISDQSGLTVKEESGVLQGTFKTLSYVEFDQQDPSVRQMALVIKTSNLNF